MKMKCPAVTAGVSCSLRGPFPPVRPALLEDAYFGLDFLQAAPNAPDVEKHREPDEHVRGDEQRRRRELLPRRQLIDWNVLSLPGRRLAREGLKRKDGRRQQQR